MNQKTSEDKPVNITIEGNATETTIVVGNGNTIKISRKQGISILAEILLGGLLPVFGCLVLVIGVYSRHQLEGKWVTGVSEVFITSIIFFSIILIGVILFMTGLGRILTSTLSAVGRATNFTWSTFISTSLKLIKTAFSSREEFVKQIKSLYNAIKAIRINVGWFDDEFSDRVKASLASLIIPGLGLYLRGRKWLGVLLLIFTIIGYGELIPGLLLHLLAVVLSGALEKPHSKTALTSDDIVQS
jgi:hypothetical protein